MTDCRTVPAAVISALAAVAAWGADDAPRSEAARQYDRLVAAYLNGRAAELAEARQSLAGKVELLTERQRDDVAYVEKASGEHRPVWWDRCKAGKRALLRVLCWGEGFLMRYTPDERTGWVYRREGQRLVCSVFWDPAEMDNDERAGGSLGGRGFSKGVVCELSVWKTLTGAHTIASMSPQELAAIAGARGPDGQVRGGDAQKKLRLDQLQSFASELTALYYVSPPARQASLVWCLAPYKLENTPPLRPRRAISAMIVATFLEDFTKWPSLKLPDEGSPPTEQATAKFYHFRLRQPWTLAEDRAFRQAVWAFHHANPREQVFEHGKVALPNGLTFLFDIEADKPHQARRDEWVRQHLAKARALRAGQR